MAKDNKDKIHLHLTVNPNNLREFKKIAKDLGVSVSALIDLIMFFVVKYYDRINEIFTLKDEKVFNKVITYLTD